MKDAQKPLKLAPAGIEKLAADYKAYERAIDAAERSKKKIREELLAQVEHYGAAAPKADKTFRLESASYIVDVTQSESLTVDDAAVLRLAESASTREMNQLFEQKSYCVKKRGAEAAVAGMVFKVRNAFRRCFVVKPASAKLTVKEKKES